MNVRDWIEKIASLWDRFLFFLYPPKCAVCKTVGFKELCPECSERLEEAFEPRKYVASGGNGFADAMFSLFPYGEEVVKELLFDWKQVEFRDLPVIFTPYFERFARKNLLPARIHCISYLPRRRYARYRIGFDQAQRISEIFAESLALPLLPLLRRRGFARTQHKTPYEKREKNVHGTFRCKKELAGQSVLLVDDIVTTGATAREGARTVKSAGAMKVYVLSVAH